MKVIYSPLVESDLLNLIDILIEEEYLYSYPFAIKYVDDLVDYVDNHINNCLHKPAPEFFCKYGNDMKYMIYNRFNITWYILFEEHSDCYFIKYITNNRYEGHCFNI